MPETYGIPRVSMYRLSLYHCYLSEHVRKGGISRITSRQIASELSLTEVTVRRDLTHLNGTGSRIGCGYDPVVLLHELSSFLGLRDTYPVIKVGRAEVMSALGVVFPSEDYGLHPVAHYSELLDDVGKIVDNTRVQHLSELPDLDPGLGVSVALVACAPPWVQQSLDLLDRAGVCGVFLMTPKVVVDCPPSMEMIHVRMSCDMKSLAGHCQIAAREVKNIELGGYSPERVVIRPHSQYRSLS